MVVVGLTRGGRLLESLTAGLWLERCCAGKVLWIGIVVAWIMEGVGGGGDGGIRLYSLLAGWPLNFHVLIVSRISRPSVYFENDFRANLEYI